MWMIRAYCKKVIEEVWNRGSNLHTPSGFTTRLKQCSNALINWSKVVFGHILKKIEEKRKILNELTVQDNGGQNGAEINRLRKEINELLNGEEVWWQQRSRV